MPKTIYNYCIYWYHLETQKHLHKEGYIGVTNDINRRHNEHFYESKNKYNRFYKAIKKYGKENILLTILRDHLSAKRAFEIEARLRPKSNIGWNTKPGGQDFLLKRPTHSVTLFHISNPEKEYKFRSIALAAYSLGIPIYNIWNALKKMSNSYDCSGWHVINKNTNKLTIKTPNSRMRQRVKLCHISNPSNILTFSSIGEASRLLNIPWPTLRARHQRGTKKFGRKDGWRILESQDTSNECVKTVAQS